MARNDNTTRQYVRTESRLVEGTGCRNSYGRWVPAQYKNVRIYRKVKAVKQYGMNPGQYHPRTGKLIPSPNDRNAERPGDGFCRTVKVRKVKKYKTVKVKKLVGTEVVSRTPVSGWHRCGSKGGCR